jgi:uncharacterized protein (DUF1697 family)
MRADAHGRPLSHPHCSDASEQRTLASIGCFDVLAFATNAARRPIRRHERAENGAIDLRSKGRGVHPGTRVMTSYVALLRAINVGGTGKLEMAELRRLCEGCGFINVATFIQSGNVVFQSKRSEGSVLKLLEQTLAERMGKPVGVLVRTQEELGSVLEHNPFPDAPPNKLIVLFLDKPAPRGALEDVDAPGGEQLAAHGREIFIHYPQGQGKSKLKLPFHRVGTGRNINTVRKLHAMLGELPM